MRIHFSKGKKGKERKRMEFVARAGCAHRSSYERAAVIGREIGSPETACLAFSSLCRFGPGKINFLMIASRVTHARNICSPDANVAYSFCVSNFYSLVPILHSRVCMCVYIYTKFRYTFPWYDDTMIKFLTVFLPTIDIPAENSATLKIDTISRLFCDKEVCLNNYLV